MSRYQVGPAFDAGPNQGTPAPSVASHYLNVDEDPNDGDATVLKVNAAADRETFGIDPTVIPEGSVITGVIIRSAKKASTAGDQTYRVGITVPGGTFYGNSWVLGAGSNYFIHEDSWAVHPVTGLAWTKTTLALAVFFHEQVTQAAGLPRPALSECVMFADAVAPIDNPSASLVSRGRSASLATRAPSATLKPKGAA